MKTWTHCLRVNPVPALLASDDEALTLFVRRDLLGEDACPVTSLWTLPAVAGLVRKQQLSGSWQYPGAGAKAAPWGNYDLLETYRNLRVLVERYGMDRSHPAIRAAADYILSCQTEEGDIRGILGNQYMPYYHGAILELLTKAGYGEDLRVERGLDWLLAFRQEDGGWIVPLQAARPKDKTWALWSGAPVPPDRSKPSSHLATGMSLRAFAAHSRYRQTPEARGAGSLLKQRLFRADKYNDRKGPQYWLKLQYPFWWTSLLTALDSLSLIGFTSDDEDMKGGLDWFVRNQDAWGLWETGYDKGKNAQRMKLWVGLAVCRVFQRL